MRRHYNRGVLRAKKDYDKAIADYTEASGSMGIDLRQYYVGTQVAH